MRERCYHHDGYFIPMCWGGVHYGPGGCYCPPAPRKYNAERIARLADKCDRMTIQMERLAKQIRRLTKAVRKFKAPQKKTAAKGV